MKWVKTEITLTQIDRARRDASNGPGSVKYGQHGRDRKKLQIEGVKSDPLVIHSRSCPSKEIENKMKFGEEKTLTDRKSSSRYVELRKYRQKWSIYGWDGKKQEICSKHGSDFGSVSSCHSKLIFTTDHSCEPICSTSPPAVTRLTVYRRLEVTEA